MRAKTEPQATQAEGAVIVPFRRRRSPTAALDFVAIPGNAFKAATVVEFVSDNRAALTFASEIASRSKAQLAGDFLRAGVDGAAIGALREDFERVHDVLQGLADVVETARARLIVVGVHLAEGGG